MKQKSLILLALFTALALAALTTLLDLFKLFLFWLGVATMPKSVADSLEEGRVVLNWLVTMPWWVAALLNIASLAISVSLIWWGVKSLVAQQKLEVVMPDGHMTAEQAKRLIEWHEWFRNQYLADHEAYLAQQDRFEQSMNQQIQDYKFEATQRHQQVSRLNEQVEGMIADMPTAVAQVANIAITGQVRIITDIALQTRENLEDLRTLIDLSRNMILNRLPQLPQDTVSEKQP